MINVGAGFDPAFRSDVCGGCIVVSHAGVYYVAATFERKPSKGVPLVPSVVTREFSQLVKSYGGRAVVTDAFYLESVREHVTAAGLATVEAPNGASGKARVHGVARELLHAGRVRIPRGHRHLIEQLGEIFSKPLPGGGIAIASPRNRRGHGDLASAFVLALWKADRGERRAAATRHHQSSGTVIYLASALDETPRHDPSGEPVPFGTPAAGRDVSRELTEFANDYQRKMRGY